MKLILTLITLTILTACSTSGTSILLDESNIHPPTNPNEIQLLTSKPEKPHNVIALVEGTAATDDYFSKKRTKEAALEALKKESARIGADAVILENIQNEEYGGMWDKIHIQGKAIIYVEQ